MTRKAADVTAAGKVIVNGREYDYPDQFTYAEKRLIRNITGLAGIDWIRAWAVFDDDVAVGLAAVVLTRAGEDVSALDGLTLEQIEIVLPTRGDADPPPAAGDEPGGPPGSSAPATGSSST